MVGVTGRRRVGKVTGPQTAPDSVLVSSWSHPHPAAHENPAAHPRSPFARPLRRLPDDRPGAGRADRTRQARRGDASPKGLVAAQKFGKDGKVNPGFLAAHEKYVAQAKEGKARLVSLGDSITAGWTRQPAIWEKAFGAYDPVNFGIGGDRTQHVLWRIENGELEVIKPKAVVLMIGTNNAGADSAEDIAKGITAIVDTIKAKQPQRRSSSLRSSPRREAHRKNGRRPREDETGQRHDREARRRQDRPLPRHRREVPVVDGNLSAAVMPDFVHLSESGYQIWADAIGPKLAELMK